VRGAFEEFSGTDRFTIRRRVGRGGMGVVYEAFDNERGTTVALKTLTGVESASVYRIKREFRALADLGHKNLVAYHELVSSEELWFFTMELVDGVDFLSAVSAPPDAAPHSDASGSLPSAHGSSGDSSLAAPFAAASPKNVKLSIARTGERSVPSDSPTRALETMLAPLPDGPESITERAVPRGAALSFAPEKTLSWWSLQGKPAAKCPDQARLKRLLRQLVAGLDALHRAGTVHGDLKPSNVLVDRQGRVVILDFGLAAETAPEAQNEQVLQGTPEYMAPEQARGSLGPASDLYALGVMLYESLVGVVPFVGGVFEILNAKQTLEPPQPSSLVDAVDPELDALCGLLLRREPAERPSLARVLELLGDEPVEVGGRGRSTFIGRDTELGALHEAARESYVGRPVVVTVSGISGMGKSALMRRFLDEIRDGIAVAGPVRESSPRTVVTLKGRCYERESVPYKAVDALMDALSRLLLKDASLAASAVPADAAALARLFPVFLDVPAFKSTDAREVADPKILRRRGFAALRELVKNLARKVALVLYIDDLQWGDADSAALLIDLLRPPEPPPVLLICAFRSDEASGSPFLDELLNPAGELRAGLTVHDIVLGPLADEQAKALAANYLRDPDEQLLTAITEEAEGSPFFITELARATGQRAHSGGSEPLPTLDKVVADRLALLTPSARSLLEVIAVAGEPIRQCDAVAAARLPSEAASDWASLRAEHMLRTRGARTTDLAETYHDRIREAVVAALPAARLASHHLALGLALEQAGHAEVEALARHFREGKDVPRARRYTLLAAEKASKALAFVRAAHLYREALELDRNADDAWLVERKVADALCNGGRGGEAWKVYRSAARIAPRADALDLERLAAEHACRTGHIDEGLALFREVTRAHGIRMATSPAEALVSLLARRAIVRVRGLSFKERQESDVPREQLQKLDACYSLAVGLGFIDPIQGADFQSRMLVEALAVGEPYRVVLGMAVEALFSATGGNASEARTTRLIETAEKLAHRVKHAHALGTVEAARAFSAIFTGRWRAGLQHAQKAETIFRTQCTNVTHEIASAQIFGLWALFHLGRLEELATLYPEHLRVHEEQGDLFAAGSKRTLIGHVFHLMRDDPKSSHACIDRGMRGWSKEGFHVQHWYELKGRVHTTFYEGDAERAYSHVEDAWGPMQRSLLSRVISIRGDSMFIRARALLLMAHRRPSRKGLLKEVEKIAKELMNDMDVLNTPGWGHALLAGIRLLDGERTKAIESMERSLRTFESVDMVTFAHGARYRLGQLVGGTRGQSMIEQSRKELSARGVAVPDRFVNMLLPDVFA
jgi:serine/threonine protein kinase/tetratricopeptide (TPR) repeat protein